MFLEKNNISASLYTLNNLVNQNIHYKFIYLQKINDQIRKYLFLIYSPFDGNFFLF